MSKRHLSILGLLALSGAVFFSASAKESPRPAPATDPRVELLKKLPPGARLEDLSLTPIPGIFEIRTGPDVAYVSADGRYYFRGDIFDRNEKNATRNNLTELRRAEARANVLTRVSESEMLVYGAKTLPYTVTVFSDIDCGYCRQFHDDVPELNKLGIRVRYMFFPRSQPGSPSWRKAEAVWCADDRKDAFTRAKRGERLEEKNCGATPVARERQLGEDLGVQGTPTLITGAGLFIGGYVPPAKLLQVLKQEKAK